MASFVPRIGRILVATDFTPNSERALAWGLFYARSFRAELIVLHVVEKAVHFAAFGYAESSGQDELVGERRVLEGLLEKHRLDGALAGRTLVELGEPAAKIREVAKREGVDLIVLGTHGKSTLEDLLFSSVATKTIRHSGCPVLAVPPLAPES
jgi:universal stress protein A